MSWAAGHRLARMLGGEHADLLAEWLAAAAGRGRRVPARLLPALLHQARRGLPADSGLRRLVAAAGGSRARWLAGLNPEWKFVLAYAPAGEDAWRLGDAAQRRGYLSALRARDPGAARDLVTASWRRPRTSSRCPGKNGPGTNGLSALIRSASWPRRPATTTRSAGGRTSSSTAGTAGLRGDRRGDDAISRRRRGATPRTRSARRTCGRCCGGASRTHERIAVVCGAWHVPALTRRCRGRGRRRLLRPAEGQGRAHLGAVDPRAAGSCAGLRRRGHARPAGTTTCSPRPTAGDAVARPGRRRAARRGRAGLVGARHRGRPAGRGARRAARPAAGRSGRGDRGGPGGAVRRRATCASRSSSAGSWSASGSARCPTTRRRCRCSAICGPSSDCGSSPEAARPRELDLDLRKETDLGRSRAAAPAAADRRAWGERRAGRARTRHVPREWRLRWQPEFAVAWSRRSMYGTRSGGRRQRAASSGRPPPRRSPT